MQNKFVVLLLFSMVTLSVAGNCDNTYSAASYALNHTKKSMGANNFDHQKYYAGRALEALEKTMEQAKICGCDKAVNAIADGMENLEKAIEQDDWDMGRHYTKKALENTQNLFYELDLYTQDKQETFNDAHVSSDEPTSEEKALRLELETIRKRQSKLAEELKLLNLRREILEEKISQTDF